MAKKKKVSVMKKIRSRSRQGIALKKNLPDNPQDIFKKSIQPKYFGLLEMRLVGEGQNKQSFFVALRGIIHSLATVFDFDGELHDHLSDDSTVGFMFFYKLSRTEKAARFFAKVKAEALEVARLKDLDLIFSIEWPKEHKTDEWIAEMDQLAHKQGGHMNKRELQGQGSALHQ